MAVGDRWPGTGIQSALQLTTQRLQVSYLAVDLGNVRGGYALSLYALGRGARWEAGAALVKGGIILLFAIAVLFEIAEKLAYGVAPSSTLMLAIGWAALVANLACLAMLWRFRAQNVNMSSTFECSRNDVVSNIGVLAAAGLVAATGSAWPDIGVGGIIALIFLRSAWRLLSEAWPIWRAAGDKK